MTASMLSAVQKIILCTSGELSTEYHPLEETKTNFTRVFPVRQQTTHTQNNPSVFLSGPRGEGMVWTRHYMWVQFVACSLVLVFERFLIKCQK